MYSYARSDRSFVGHGCRPGISNSARVLWHPPSQHRPPGPGVPGGGIRQLQIINAKYGAGRRQVDVTGRLQSLANNGRLSIQVTLGSLAVADPAPNVIKTLFVSYSVGNGARQTRSAQDGGYITLP